MHKAQPLEHNLPEVECQVACTSKNRGFDRNSKTKSVLWYYLQHNVLGYDMARTNSIGMALWGSLQLQNKILVQLHSQYLCFGDEVLHAVLGSA